MKQHASPGLRAEILNRTLTRTRIHGARNVGVFLEWMDDKVPDWIFLMILAASKRCVDDP